MAVVYGKRCLFWMQLIGTCIYARTKSALSSQHSAKPKPKTNPKFKINTKSWGCGYED
jgi:hypothetical protein